MGVYKMRLAVTEQVMDVEWGEIAFPVLVILTFSNYLTLSLLPYHYTEWSTGSGRHSGGRGYWSGAQRRSEETTGCGIAAAQTTQCHLSRRAHLGLVEMYYKRKGKRWGMCKERERSGNI